MLPDPIPAARESARFQWLAKAGRRLFAFRLYIGLTITLIALEIITPKPFFGAGVRAIQAIGLLIIAAGLLLRAWGTGCAGFHTRSKTIEAPRLVTGGPFAYLRNPIYTGSMLLGLGMVFVIGDPFAVIFAGAAIGILYFSIVPAEEAFLLQKFGEEYVRYKQSVPRFIPRLRAWPGRAEGSFHWRAIWGEAGIALLLVVIYAAIWGEEYLDRIWG